MHGTNTIQRENGVEDAPTSGRWGCWLQGWTSIAEFVGAAERQHAKPGVHMVGTLTEQYYINSNVHNPCTRWWQKQGQGGLVHGGVYSRSIAKVACQEIVGATMTNLSTEFCFGECEIANEWMEVCKETWQWRSCWPIKWVRSDPILFNFILQLYFTMINAYKIP